ncbi:helix-turn-helix domain-containing protein, partial [Allorhizocola rhizosphaerae]|uniref:helix-turn-helix domain-containing protein n=1 Tax=Allorhizocola rhizosphaerae TaxID=1872709 RepID=UPI0013C2FC43
MGQSFAEIVRSMRERMMLSQEELAARCAPSVSTVRGLEAGRVGRPRPATVRQLAAVLNLSGADRDRLLAAARGEPSGPPLPAR